MQTGRIGLTLTLLLVPANLILAFIKVQRGETIMGWGFNVAIAFAVTIFLGLLMYVKWRSAREWRELASKGIRGVVNDRKVIKEVRRQLTELFWP